MSAEPQSKGWGSNTYATRSKAQIAKNADSMYSSTFEDLEPGTIYRDPLGMRAKKQVRLQEKMHEARKPLLEAFDELQDSDWSVSESVRQIRKNLDTGDWSLPIDHIPDVFVVNPERTPMADMMARETTDSETVLPTRITDDPSPSWGLETTNDTEGSYDYADPSYGDNSFDVVGVGYATRIEDKLRLAANSLRSSETVQQQSLLRGIRQEVERQIILGTNNSASGWDGFDDLGTVVQDNGDPTSPTDDWDVFLRDLIDETEYDGAPRENLAVVTDFDTHQEIRSDLISNVRYNDPEEELVAGFSTLTFDNVPIFKSHAIERLDNRTGAGTYNQIYVVNMESTYLSMLQETSVKPLARVAPQEQFAVDQYGVLTAEAPEHINIGSVTVP